MTSPLMLRRLDRLSVWTVDHLDGGAENAELDNAEPDITAPCSRGGHRRTWQCGTI